MSIGINQISSRERQVGFFIAVATAIVLTLRVALSVAEYGGLVEALTHLTQYFTILTNAAVMTLAYTCLRIIERCIFWGVSISIFKSRYARLGKSDVEYFGFQRRILIPGFAFYNYKQLAIK